jgi:uncharacterized protein DUF6328
MANAPSPKRRETAFERADRNLAEILAELRVALPGVQVLFAFLLTVPFTRRFEELSQFQENVYFVTLLAAALSSALLIAPSVHHRVLFRLRDKPYIVSVANRLALAGLGALALAMTGVVLLITDFLFAPVTAILVTSATGLLFCGLWYGVPLRRRLARR